MNSCEVPWGSGITLRLVVWPGCAQFGAPVFRARDGTLTSGLQIRRHRVRAAELQNPVVVDFEPGRGPVLHVDDNVATVSEPLGSGPGGIAIRVVSKG